MVLKENVASAVPEVKWIGSCDVSNVHVPRLAHKSAYFYKKCIFGELCLSVGDYVLVSNADAADPDTIEGCDIAKVLHLYELREDSNDRDPYRAIVQWYSRPECVPHKEFDDDEICLDFSLEVIEEHRPYDTDISVETIFRKCIMLRGEADDSAHGIIQLYKSKHKPKSNCPMFVCRYKFVKVKNKYRLVPLGFNTDALDGTPASVARKGRRKSCAEESTYSSQDKASSRSASAQKPKVDSFKEIKRRRASVAAASAIEFIDCNYLASESKVSPIKIVGGKSVVRLSAKKRMATPDDADESSGSNSRAPLSPLTQRNIKVQTPNKRVATARRNLNLSLEKGADTSVDSDCLNYSIVKTPTTAAEPTNDMKIKLRLSGRHQRTKLAAMDEQFSDPLASDNNFENVAKSTPDEIYCTPTKKSKAAMIEAESEKTPSTRRKSILKSASRRQVDSTPKRNIQLSDIVEKHVFNEDDIISTPKRKPKAAERDMKRSALKNATLNRRNSTSTVAAVALTPSQKLKMFRAGELSPSIGTRKVASTSGTQRKTDLQLARESLHVSVVPQSLPCREKEFDNIYAFLEGKIQDQCGGCMYVSGVPGTGKTATVSSVIRMLQSQQQSDKLPPFEFVEINGMRLTEPRQAYVQIYKQLTGKSVSWEHAHTLLEKRFTTPAPRRVTTVLLVDELDIICNRRQDVVYNLLDWPTKAAARLVVITIANTMDLPERLLRGKVTSRLGLTRLTFQPYSHKQLQEIVTMRISNSDAFKSDAVQLVARKVAAVSGDARRALDICRRAAEIAEMSKPTDKGHRHENAQKKCVSILHVQQALSEMIASAKVQAIKHCSRLEQIFLQAVLAEVTRTGVEETSFLGVYSHVENMTAFEGLNVPTTGNCLRICSHLSSQRLLIAEHSRNDIFQKILLNVSGDDIHYALNVNNV